MLENQQTKQCIKCGEVKLISEFYKDSRVKGSKDGFRPKCKKCTKVYYWCSCSLKNKTTHIDHYEPLSRGGAHTISNLVVSCSNCNLRKRAKDPIEFAQSIGRLL